MEKIFFAFFLFLEKIGFKKRKKEKQGKLSALIFIVYTVYLKPGQCGHKKNSFLLFFGFEGRRFLS